MIETSAIVAHFKHLTGFDPTDPDLIGGSLNFDAMQLMRAATEGERRVVQRSRTLLRDKAEIITSAGDNRYDPATTLVGRRITEARWRRGTSDSWHPMLVTAYDAMRERHPDLDVNIEQGEPRELAIDPDGGEIVLWPMPIGTVTVQYSHVTGVATLALAADPLWFFRGLAADGSATAYSSGNWMRSLIDFPRTLTVQIQYRQAQALAHTEPITGWNAATNTPALADGTGDSGQILAVTTGGTLDLGSGAITFSPGDLVRYNGASWIRIPGGGTVRVLGRSSGGQWLYEDITVAGPNPAAGSALFASVEQVTLPPGGSNYEVNLGLGSTFASSQYQAISNLPDDYAESIGALFAAYRYYQRRNRPDAAAEKFGEYQERSTALISELFVGDHRVYLRGYEPPQVETPHTPAYPGQPWRESW